MYSGAAKEAGSDSNIDDVCKLLGSTGMVYATGAKRPSGYPEKFFNRVQVNPTFVSIIVERLLSDDVYNQVRNTICLVLNLVNCTQFKELVAKSVYCNFSEQLSGFFYEFIRHRNDYLSSYVTAVNFLCFFLAFMRAI